MLSLTTLWLPILLSAVFVFVASFISQALLPFWHRRDHDKLPDEAVVIGGLTTAKSGQYIAPHVNWGKLSKEEKEAHEKRPMALLMVRNPAQMSLGAALAGWFVELLVISTIIGWIAGTTVGRGYHRHSVFYLTALAGILAYAFDGVSMSIWYGKPWGNTFKTIVDGIVYGVLIGLTFAWLWPL